MTKESDKDILNQLGQLLQAGAMLRSGKVPQKEKLKTEPREPRGKPAMKKDAGVKTEGGKYAEIKAKEGTEAWHEEVYKGLESRQLVPKATLTTESVATAKAHLAIEANKDQIEFLLKGKQVPDNDIVVQTFADIARSPYKNNPKFLIAKEAQMLSSASGLPVAEQGKILAATSMLDRHIAETFGKTEPAYVRMTLSIHANALEREMKGNKDELEEEEDKVAESEHELTAEEEEVLADVRTSIHEALTASAGKDAALIAKAQELKIPNEAAVFIGVQIADGVSFKKAVRNYAEAVKAHIKNNPAENIGTIVFLKKTGEILKDPTLVTMPEVKGGSGATPPPKVYDDAWGLPDGDLKNELITLSEKLKFNYYAANPRKIEDAIERLTKYKAEFPAGHDITGELNTYREGLMKDIQEAQKGRGEDVTEQFSGLFLQARLRGLTVLYPKWITNELYRKFNEMITYNTRGQIAEQFMRNIGQVADYYANDQFEQDIRGMFENPERLLTIEHATGMTLASVGGNVEQHPFYTDRLAACNAAKKEVADLMNAKENLTYAYGVIKSGEEFKIHKSVLGELGDRGVFTIKTSNDYLTGVAYDLFDTLATDLGYDWVKGGARRVGDEEMEILFKTVTELMTQNKPLLEKRFEAYWKAESSLPADGDYSELEALLGIKGKDKDMNFGDGDERMIGMIKEAQKLYTASLREVYARERSLSPGESGGQRGQAPKYGAEEGIYQYIRGRRPIAFFIERWDLPSAAGRLHLHVMADQYARLMGIDKAIEPDLNHAMGDIQFKRKLVERALGVVEKAGEQPALQTFFEFDLNGNKIEHPPESVEALTKEQLKQLVLYKEGVRYADLVLGSYDYEGATWISSSRTTAFDLAYGSESWKRGIGMGEIKRVIGGSLIGAETHKARKAAEDKLIFGGENDNGRGVLRVYADFMPQRGFQDLMEHSHIGMRQKYHAMVEEGMFEDMFHKRHSILTKDGPKDEWRAVIITKNEPEMVYRFLKPIHRMTDEMIAYGKDLTGQHDIDVSPINYALDPTPEQDAWLSKICENMHVDKNKYLAVMKRFSKYVGLKDQLEEMVKPQYLDTYTTVQDLDSRAKFLDNIDQAPGTQFVKGTDVIEGSVVPRASGFMGGQEGKSKMSGLARVGGDCANASDNALLMPDMLGQLSEKKLLQTLPDYAKNTLFVYGNTWKHRAVGIMVGSWMKCARMDPLKDWTLYGSLNTLSKSSPYRRVTGLTGDHGAPTMTLNELHKFWDQMQIDAGVTMVDAEHLNHFEEYELGLVTKSGSHLPWYIYTYSLAGVLASVGLVAALTHEASEGFKEGSSVSVGGGQRSE